MDNDMPEVPPEQGPPIDPPKEEINENDKMQDENNDAADEANCKFDDESDTDSDLEEMLNYKLAIARMKLKRGNAIFHLLQDAQLHELCRIQKKKQEDMALTMFHYVKRRHDIRSRNGRCPTCKYLRSIFT